MVSVRRGRFLLMFSHSWWRQFLGFIQSLVSGPLTQLFQVLNRSSPVKAHLNVRWIYIRTCLYKRLNVTSSAVITWQVTTIKWVITDAFYRNLNFLPPARTDIKYWFDSGYWTWSQIITNSQLTPQPAEPQDASAPSLWSHFAKFLQQTCLSRKSHRDLKLSQLVSGSYLFSMFRGVLCAVVSYLVEKQNCSEQRALGRE